MADRQAELLGTIAGQSLPAGDNPLPPLHPRAFAILARGSVSAISQAFSDLLVQAGWKARPAAVSHRSRAIGHSGRRKINALSFHSLRRITYFQSRFKAIRLPPEHFVEVEMLWKQTIRCTGTDTRSIPKTLAKLTPCTMPKA